MVSLRWGLSQPVCSLGMEEVGDGLGPCLERRGQMAPASGAYAHGVGCVSACRSAISL